MLSRTLRSGLSLTELGFGAAQLGNLLRQTTDDEAARRGRRARGTPASATSTPRRTTDSASRSAASARPSPTARGTSTCSRRRSAASSCRAAYPERHRWTTRASPCRRPRAGEWDLSRDGIRRSIDESLERLGLDRIDIAYLHDPDDARAAGARRGHPGAHRAARRGRRARGRQPA